MPVPWLNLWVPLPAASSTARPSRRSAPGSQHKATALPSAVPPPCAQALPARHPPPRTPRPSPRPDTHTGTPRSPLSGFPASPPSPAPAAPRRPRSVPTCCRADPPPLSAGPSRAARPSPARTLGRERARERGCGQRSPPKDRMSSGAAAPRAARERLERCGHRRPPAPRRLKDPVRPGRHPRPPRAGAGARGSPAAVPHPCPPAPGRPAAPRPVPARAGAGGDSGARRRRRAAGGKKTRAPAARAHIELTSPRNPPSLLSLRSLPSPARPGSPGNARAPSRSRRPTRLGRAPAVGWGGWGLSGGRPSPARPLPRAGRAGPRAGEARACRPPGRVSSHVPRAGSSSPPRAQGSGAPRLGGTSPANPPGAGGRPAWDVVWHPELCRSRWVTVSAPARREGGRGGPAREPGCNATLTTSVLL